MAESLEIVGESIVEIDRSRFAVARLADGQKRLVVEGKTGGFIGSVQNDTLICAQTPENAAVLRSRLPWLNPQQLGTQKSFGFGDRIGLATPGHVASLRAAGGNIAPIFAQQSVRENERTGRTPQQVLDDATWGIIEKGWRGSWGADADHVKDIADIKPFVDAGYTFYTIDPSDHVDNAAQTDDAQTLAQKAAALPWRNLGNDHDQLSVEYCTSPIVLDGLRLEFDEETLLRALAKYGRALAHTISLSQEITRQMGGKEFDLEMSVDETDTPTSAEEHYFIANELLRRDVPVVSLAPRFVGKFQKGVDYTGDIGAFRSELAKHAAVMDYFGRYKLSIHTGSDKFSIYSLISRHTHGRVHVKTAGTSYLEALRVISQKDTGLFREILDLGHRQFEFDRKTYFLDCDPRKVPLSSQLADDELPALLDDFDARQLLHVTFGSALDACGSALKADLIVQELPYESALVHHFLRHLAPFV